MLVDIENVDDPRVAAFTNICTHQKRDEATIIIEGARALSRAFEAKAFEIHQVLVTPAAWLKISSEFPALENFLSRSEILRAENALVQSVVGFPFHRGCIAIASQLPESSRPLGNRRIILDRVVDPDNLGSIFRSAYALGFTGVVCGAGSADPLYRKAIRTSMGCTLSLPFLKPENLAEYCQSEILNKGGTLVALEIVDKAQCNLKNSDTLTLSSELLSGLIVGNEGEGISPLILNLAQSIMEIPMARDDISLNVSVAAALGMHAFLGVKNKHG